MFQLCCLAAAVFLPVLITLIVAYQVSYAWSSIRSFGLDVVTDLCANLLEHGAPGLHFYTLNQAGLTTTIWQRLGLS